MRIILSSEAEYKFSKILAMTFTNKAANEMKERILDKLIQLSKAPHDRSEKDLEEIKNYSKALGIPEKTLCERADIQLNYILHHYSLFGVMTIDKFTHRVIRTFARELGLSLDFEVELDLKTLRGNVADLLFDQIGRSKEITTLMTQYAEKNLQDDKSWNFKESLVKFSEELFKEDAIEAIKMLERYDGKRFLEAQKEMAKENKIILNKLQTPAQLAVDLIKAKGIDPSDFVGKSRSFVFKFEKIAFGDLKPFTDKQVEKSEESEWGHPESPNKGTADSISGQLKEYLDQIQLVFEQDYPKYILNQELLRIVNNLSLMNHLLKMTEEVKKNENVLLISDFYKMIAEVITKEPVPFIYERLGVRYEHFLLDEFQDTSHLQWVNLVPLLHNSLSQGFSNLIVGDGKQAIYRWRNGEVEQFVKLPEEIYNPGGIASLKEAESTFSHEGELISLKSNYRSAPEIVKFNNELFRHLTGSKDESIRKIYQSGEQTAEKKHSGFVELFSTEEKDDQIQLDYISKTIEKSLSKGYHYSDICILVNRNKLGSTVATHLSSQNISVVSKDSLYVGRDQEVKFIYNLIGALASPQNLNFAKKAIEHYDLINDFDSHLFEIGKERFKIKDWMAGQGIEIGSYEHFHSFYEYVEHLIIKFKLDISDNRYLEFFLEQIFEYEKRNNGNIHSFIEWFEQHGKRESIQSPEGADAVNVMTIHKAKGLQFPIVICAFFDWNINDNKTKKWIIDEEAHLPAFVLPVTEKTKGSSYSEVFSTETVKHDMDELNKLYVALTRPENALFICGSTKKTKSLIGELILPQLPLMGLDIEDTVSIGSFHSVEEQTHSPSEPFEIEFCQQVMDKPKLSTTNGDLWDADEIDKKRKFGIQLHMLLSNIKRKDDIQVQMNSLRSKGKISEEFFDDIKAQAEVLFNDPHFMDYFEADEILNEQVIVDADGHKHIPDKMIFNDGKVKVVDFKSGEESKSHLKQVRTYIALIKEMGYENVSGELYYTESKKPIVVPSE